MKPRALTKWRKAQGMSGPACAGWLSARGAPLDAAQLWRWEKGERIPRPATVAAVAKATGLKVESLAPRGD